MQRKTTIIKFKKKKINGKLKTFFAKKKEKKGKLIWQNFLSKYVNLNTVFRNMCQTKRLEPEKEKKS